MTALLVWTGLFVALAAVGRLLPQRPERHPNDRPPLRWPRLSR